ncbi:hypothetical protein [Devosia sp. DBB001]|nr:hypothetical protein [Devosia sp. DBB001]
MGPPGDKKAARKLAAVGYLLLLCLLFRPSATLRPPAASDS